MKDIQGKQHRLEQMNERIAEMDAELQANPNKKVTNSRHAQLCSYNIQPRYHVRLYRVVASQ